MFLFRSLFKSSRSNASIHSIESTQSLPISDSEQFPFPVNARLVKKSQHHSPPKQLPDSGASVKEVRYFLYTLLTSDHHRCAAEYPEWVLETCMRFSGNGYDLRNYSEQQLMQLCPITATAVGIETKKHKPGCFVPTRARNMIGEVISRYVMCRKRKETQIKDVHRGWQQSQEKLHRHSTAFESPARAGYAQSMLNMPTSVSRPTSPVVSLSYAPNYGLPATTGPINNLYIPRRPSGLRTSTTSTMESVHGANVLPHHAATHANTSKHRRASSMDQAYRAPDKGRQDSAFSNNALDKQAVGRSARGVLEPSFPRLNIAPVRTSLDIAALRPAPSNTATPSTSASPDRLRVASQMARSASLDFDLSSTASAAAKGFKLDDKTAVPIMARTRGDILANNEEEEAKLDPLEVLEAEYARLVAEDRGRRTRERVSEGGIGTPWKGNGAPEQWPGQFSGRRTYRDI
ncbi:hypothetical protein CC86DRAFT_400662 [Ophiobolus disseminans]|uniref:Uncharacterized protein n=1 Tax=Ophiobolus disseminans TaxID=1469910 RepID=A0A6A7AGT2_9PLEO|nr:hypothetical protein CC86DRAFT_400662 [Ophiobolus disseminans]